MSQRQYSDGSPVESAYPTEESRIAYESARLEGRSPIDTKLLRASTSVQMTTMSARLLPRVKATEAIPFRDLTESYARDALEILHEALISRDFRTRFQAARDLVWLAARLPQKEATESGSSLSAEQREAKLEQAVATPEVRAWLAAHGWTEPKTPPDPPPEEETKAA